MVTVGSTLAGYRIEGVAGRGGMGIVYRARQLRPDRLVALKVLATELLDDPQFRERFERESSIAASIEHPHVVPVYEVDEAGGALFIAMRYVDGPDLRSLIRVGLGPDQSARLVEQTARALDAAHARSLVHRDVKPANVLVAEADHEPHAYLTDFGLTKHIEMSRGPTRPGALVGTIDYTAPEQIRGEKIDARADVYSLACLLYECLTGRVPYPYEADAAKLWAHVSQSPPSLRAAGIRMPQQWEEIIERGMAKEPADRYPSAGDLGRAVLAALAAKPPPARERMVATGTAAPQTRTGATAPVTSEAATVSPADGERTRPAPSLTARSSASKVARRRFAILAAATLALLAAAAGLAIVVGDGRRARPAPTVGRIAGAPIPVGRTPTALAAGEGAIWVANLRDRSVARIDPASRSLEGKPIRVGREPYGVAVGEGSVWVANFRDDTVSRIDPRSSTVVGQPIPVGSRPSDVAFGFGAVWTANYEDDSVTRIDARSGERLKTIRVGDGPTDVAIGEGAVWVGNVEGDTVSRINPASNEVVGAPIPVGDSPESVAVGAGAVWVANIKADTVTRIDPASNQVAGPPAAVGERPDDLVAADGGVYVANLDADTLTRIDPRSGKAAGRGLRVGNGPAALTLAGDTLWVANFEAGTVVSVVR